jgi:predicted DNA-binding protein (MmcQ/YjbR family)
VPTVLRKAYDKVLAHALGYPGAWEDHPWGENVVKVGKKVFLFSGGDDTQFSISVKLPESADFALGMDWTEPTGYGMGRHGWVSATFTKGAKVPLDLLCDWVDESYRAIAPKKLIAELDGR